jgi:DNA-binding response OmpR family regulator
MDKKHILVAEDEKPLARALSLKLEKEGFTVEIANDGEVLHEKIAAVSYDLILMDLMMPKHDGFLFMEKMKAEGNTTPVIIMSNLSQDTDRNRAAAAGASHYFVKSDVPLSEIVLYIKTLFGNS